jgi:hypothetical protein
MISLSLFHIFNYLLLLEALTDAQSVPDVEVNALYELYNCTGGENWLWREEVSRGSKWNFTRSVDGSFTDSPCSSGDSSNKTWQGVTCSDPPPICVNTECHITALSLVAYNLEGPIPPDIGDAHLLLNRCDAHLIS